MESNLEKLFNESYLRCTKQREFFDRFYDLFLSQSDDVRELFKDTDFKRQHQMLARSFDIIVSVSEESPEFDSFMGEVKARHKKMSIPVGVYQAWVDCLIEAVRLTDPKFDKDIESAWRQVIKRGVDFMQSA